MAQDIVNENQKISYTNLDFSAIYSETIDLIKQLTYKWDPSISNESDPGVVLVKLSALLADKMNYNIDKNILETFPLSVTQDGNARQLYDQLGYYMDWYVSGAAPISLNWTGETLTETDAQGNISTVTYKIPKFTTIIDSEQSVSKRYSLIGIEGAEDNIVSDILLTTDGKTVIALALEGLAVQYQYEGETVITAQMVDPFSRRLYFTTSNISQNGIFIKNTNQENYASWKRVNNLYEDSFDELRYVFGYDSNTNTCFLEFPDNYSELFGSGIEITYLLIDPTASDIPAGDLTQFMTPITLRNSKGDMIVSLSSDNVKLTNYLASSGHKNVESINEAYVNYKKTVGTFKTLITLRDYANFIRNKSLNICSNAFVCDRTNDIQTSYKIMNRSEGLDNLIVKVEQLVDRDSIESTFEYTYRLSSDTTMDSSKTYYYIQEDTLQVAPYDETKNPVEERYYEFEGTSSLRSYDAMDPFSLKFYLLKNSIAIDTKSAYNDTFTMLNPYPDLNSVFSDTSHIEHIYENLLSLGADSYKRSTDDSWDENKSYWLYDTNNKIYNLITSTDPTEYIGETPATSNNVYEIDVEALMPHIVLYKAIYPIIMNVSTYTVLDTDTQNIIKSNIIKALYPALASSEMNWGEEVSLEYLNKIAKSADDRIKAVTVEPISYDLHAIYYDKDLETFTEVEVNTELGSFTPASQRNLNDIVSSRIKQDIFSKSVLAGTSQLLVKDDKFTYHLSQEFYAYEDGIRAIEPEAVIDIESDASTGLSTSSTDSYIRKSYTLKENELLSLYRPQFYTTQEFLNGVHYEYVLYNGLSSDKSYKLNAGEYIIFYTPILDSDNTTLEGYKTYACAAGSIISSTFDINAQSSFNALSNFARGSVIPNLGTDKYREFNTYNNSYVTEIQSSTFIVNNKITGSNAIKVEEVNIAEIKITDKFKFFWLLNQPTYSSNENLKTFTLFDSYDSETQSAFTESINTYTLKSGEYFIYTNSDYSVPEIVGAGTTIIRNCGVDTSEYYPIENSIYYAYWGKLSQIVQNGTFLNSTDNENNLKVQAMGLYEATNASPIQNISEDINPFEKGYYEALIDADADNIIYYQPTKDIVVNPETIYYEVEFTRTDDIIGTSGTAYYVLCMREDEGAYKVTSEDVYGNKTYALDSLSTGSFEEVSLIDTDNNGEVTFVDPVSKGLYKQVGKYDDKYALYEGASITNNGRYAAAENIATDKNTFLEHDSLVIDRKILRNNSAYKNISINEPSTYATIDLDKLTFNTQELGIYEPVTYRKYYEYDSGNDTYTEVQNINMFTDPCGEGYYVLEDGTYIPCDDPTEPRYLMHSPEVETAKLTDSIELFNELPVTYDAELTKEGYYYKSNEVDKVYTKYNSNNYIYLDASKIPEAGSTTPPLDYLFKLYNLYDSQAESPYILEQIYNAWHQNYSYMAPYNPSGELFNVNNSYYYNDLVYTQTSSSDPKIYYKCIVDESTSGSMVASEWVRVDTNWRIFDFTQDGEWQDNNYQDKYVKFTAQQLFDTFITSSNKAGNLYPAKIEDNVINGVPYFYISASIAAQYRDTGSGGLPIENTTPVYTIETYPTIELDNDEYLRRFFPNKEYSSTSATKNIKQVGELKVYYLPKLHQFKDYFLLTNTKYYKQKELYRRLCEQIDAWTCSALNINEIVDDPINNIGTLWASMQTNTSITIIQNEILSFGEGDTIVFQTNEATSDSVNWPRFTNEEITLDVGDSYTVSYRRKGDEIQKLSEVNVDEYKWRGYSTLQVNLAGKNGQKLESNHSIAVYENETDVNPIAKFSGSEIADITFQLKNPVKNTNGNFLNVYTVDAEGNQENNAIYAFVSRANGDYYKYNSYDYSTSLLFNNGDSPHDTIELPVKLPGGKYLLAIQMKNDIILEAIYNNYYKYNNIVSINIDTPVVANENGSPILENNFKNIIHSYRDDSTSFTGNNYDYLYIDNGKDNYRKINAPSLVATSYSPKTFGWYEYDEDSGIYNKTDISDLGAALLIKVTEEELEGSNPYESKWYYYEDNDDSTDIKLTTIDDIEPRENVDYYREPDLFVAITDLDSSIEFKIDKTDTAYIYTIEDIFKFEPNDIGDFGLIREKVRKLDYDNEYNYTFTPKNNDLISNPLLAKSFFNTNHIFNDYIMPQLNVDDIEIRFITTKAL